MRQNLIKRLPALDNGINQFDLKNPKIQEFISSQVYTKGFSYTCNAGSNSFTPVLGGKPRWLYGIAYYGDINTNADRDIMSLSINEEMIIDKVITWNYNPQQTVGNVYKTEQFYPLPRPLSGSDSVALTIVAIQGKPIDIVFFLSDRNPFKQRDLSK